MESIIVSDEIKEEQLPTYYSVLPASVRYCKSLTPFEKVLYSELSCLTTIKGYCFATNSYFAKIYDCSTKTISRSFSNLEKNGFIKMQLLKKSSGEVVQRRIFLLSATPFSVQPTDKKVSDNIIKSNTINNNILKNTPFPNDYLLTAQSAEDYEDFLDNQDNNLNLTTDENKYLDNFDSVKFDFKNKEKEKLNLDEYNYLKNKVDNQDYDIFDKLLTKQDDNTFLVNKNFRSAFLDAVGIDYIILLDYLNNKSKLKCNNSRINEFNDENVTKRTRSGQIDDLFEKTTNYTTEEKKTKKTRKSQCGKDLSDLQKIKNHYLENRKKMYEQGKCSSPIDSTNSVVINKRLNDLLNKGVSVDQFFKVLDFAMTDKFCIDIDYRFLPLIKDNVFFKLYNNKDCHCVEPIAKKPEISFKNIQLAFPKCEKCGFDLDASGKCPFCDYD